MVFADGGRVERIVIGAAQTRVEVAVIGSGPGGAITACLLAEAGRKVALIEEGPFLKLEETEAFSREEMALKYRNGGITPTFGKAKVAYVEGRCVGGGSEINAALYHRTPPEVLENWAREFQLQGSGAREMEPFFEACEKEIGVSVLPHAAPAASLKLREGAERLGWKAIEVPRCFRYEPDASVPMGFREKRQSMTRTYLPRFLAAGGTVTANTRVKRLRREGVVWLLICDGGKKIFAETVFVCAGAVQTPALLRRSGITRNVGNNFRLHPTLKITALFREPINSREMGIPVHQVKEFSPRLSFGCSISTPPYLALGVMDAPGELQALEKNWTRLGNYYVMITSGARGSVRNLPGFGDPLVRYNLGEEDFRNLADGGRKLAQILLAAGAEKLFPSIASFGAIEKESQLAAFGESVNPRRTNLMSIHLFSSCPMGENRNVCATDSFGKAHGFESLFVNDASLLCTAPGVNPQGSVMAFARRNALKWLGKL